MAFSGWHQPGSSIASSRSTYAIVGWFPPSNSLTAVQHWRALLQATMRHADRLAGSINRLFGLDLPPVHRFFLRNASRYSRLVGRSFESAAGGCLGCMWVLPWWYCADVTRYPRLSDSGQRLTDG